MFAKHECPDGNKVQIGYVKYKGHGQGHRPWCHLKVFYKLSMHAKNEVSIFNGSKVMAQVKLSEM